MVLGDVPNPVYKPFKLSNMFPGLQPEI